MFKTRVTELFGIEYPIVQGGLMWIARAELVSAVANAGGIGFLTALTHPTPEGLAAEIRKTREMTDKPFGVNLTFLPTLIPVDYEPYIDACIAEGIRFMETAGRNPEPYIGKMKKAGIGLLTLYTVPRAAVFDGNTSLGTTPLMKVPLQAGTYRLRVVDPEGNSRLFSAPVELAKDNKYTIKVSDLPPYAE